MNLSSGPVERAGRMVKKAVPFVRLSFQNRLQHVLEIRFTIHASRIGKRCENKAGGLFQRPVRGHRRVARPARVRNGPRLRECRDRRCPQYRWVDESAGRSEEHTSELQSPKDLVCRLLLEKKKT